MRDESERWDESASEGSNHKPGGEAETLLLSVMKDRKADLE